MDSSHTFSKKNKVITSLSFWLTFFIISFVLYLSYTEVGKLIIRGFQGRYLISVLPLLLMNINSKKVIKDNNELYTYNGTCMVSGFMIILDLLAMIIK